MAHHIRSRLFLAHVSASTGSEISRDNGQPFTVGTWSFMHNGQAGGFEYFRKLADMCVPDVLSKHRKSATDSEVLFLMALGEGLDRDPKGALSRAVARVESLLRQRCSTPHMRLSAAFLDGKRLFAVRYSSDHIAPSVYYRWSETRQGWAVVSGPLEPNEDGCTALAPGTFLELSDDGVTLSDFGPGG